MTDTGMNNAQTIQKLLQVEREPLKRLVEDNARNKVKIEAWEELRVRSRKLADLSRELYSFAGPFSRKSIVSSDPGAITGEAASHVEPGSQQIEVVQLASRHQIRTRNVAVSESIPAGQFTIQAGESSVPVRFRGGDINALEKAIRQQAADDFEITRIQVTSEEVILSLRSAVEGKDGAFRFKDPDGILKYVELAGNVSQKEVKKDPVKLDGNVSGDYKLSADGKELNTESEAVIQTEPKPDSVLRMNLTLLENTNSEDEPASATESVTPGPDVTVNVGDVELKADTIDRTREKNPAKQSEKGSAKVTVEMSDGKSFDFNYSKSGPVEYNFGKLAAGVAPKSVTLSAGDSTSLKVTGVVLSYEDESEGSFGPVHETEPARDAKLKINGIEVTRNKNDGLTDIIDGASLNLHRKTAGPVAIEVKAHTEEIKKKVEDWVAAYNDLMKFVKDNDSFEGAKDFKMRRSDDPNGDIDEGLRRIQNQSGIFAGDATTRQLTMEMSTLAAQAYPSSEDPSLRVLADIGITTGAPGADWSTIKDGYLQIDHAVLESRLAESPESVRELFASDTNEDAVPDNGLGYKMNQSLQPFVRFSGGLITARVNLLKQQITDNKDTIYKKELSLKNKEEMLRRKFGRMDSAIQKGRSTSNYLKSKLGAPGN